MNGLPHTDPTVASLVPDLAGFADPVSDSGNDQPQQNVTPDPLPQQNQSIIEPLILPDATEPCSDFISSYVTYADRLELPPIMHELTALTGIAALVNGKITIKNGGQRVSLDIWTLLISSSGGGRNTLASLFRECLRSCGLASLVSTESWGSGMAMQESFAKCPDAKLHVWEEMSAMMLKFQQRDFQGALEWLTNLYDNFEIPPAVRYRAGKGSKPGKPGSNKTPDIVFTAPPRTNLLSLTSEAWFLDKTSEIQAKGGFTPRWCPLIVREPGRFIATPAEADASLLVPMTKKLRLIEGCRGEMRVEGALQKEYQKWYEQMKRRFMAQPNAGLAEVFANRHRVHFLKLWALYEVSLSASLNLSKASFDRAVAMCRRIEETILTLLKTGFTSEGAESYSLEERILATGATGLSQTELCSSYRGGKFRDVKDRVSMLLSSGLIECFERKPTGRGRPARFYVHRDHLDQHEKQFPDDKRA